MNGKVFSNVTGQSFSLTDKKDGTYHLTRKVQQIGKMHYEEDFKRYEEELAEYKKQHGL